MEDVFCDCLAWVWQGNIGFLYVLAGGALMLFFTFLPRKTSGYSALLSLCMIIMLGAGAFGELRAQTVPSVQVMAMPEKTHVRFRFTFEKQTNYELEISDGLFAVRLDKAHDFRVGDIENNSHNFVIAHRLDPDKKGIRFALGGQAKVIDQAAAEFLIIDVLPLGWQSAPPPLPSDIIAVLKERAEESMRNDKESKRSSRQSVVDRPIVIKAGENPTFTRLVVEGYGGAEPRISRAGAEIHLDFPFDSDVNIDQIRQNMPRGLDAIDLERFNGHTTVIFSIDPKHEIRSLGERTRFIIDILGLGDQGALDNQGAQPSDNILAQLLGEPANDNGYAQPNQKQATTAFLGKVDETQVAINEAAESLPAPQPVKKVQLAKTQPVQSDILQQEATAAVVDEPSEIKPLLNRDVKLEPQSGDNISVAKANSYAPLDEGNLEDVPKVAANHIPLQVSAYVPAVAFARGRQVYLGFAKGSIEQFDDEALLASNFIDAAEQRSFDNVDMILVTLKEPEIFALYPLEGQWWLDVGDIQEHQKSVRKVQRIADENGVKIVIPMDGVKGTLAWEDPFIGDRLRLVLAPGPVQSVYQAADTAEFQLLPSLHGAVIAPRQSGVNIRTGDGSVIVEREGGLKASYVQSAQPRQAASHNNKSRSTLNFDDWYGKGRFVDNQSRLLLAIANSYNQQATMARLSLAKFYIARNMPQEALGALEGAASADLLVKKTIIFPKLKGIALLLNGETAKAEKVLKSTPLILHDLEMSPWLGLLAAQKGNAQDAYLLMGKAMPFIEKYSYALQIPLRFAYFDSALEGGNLNKAEEELFFLNRLPLNHLERSRLTLLQARLADKLGKTEEAEKKYIDSIKAGYPPVESHARFDFADFALRHDKVDAEGAIEELQKIAVAWRGDEIEVDSLVQTADLLVKQKRYAEAFDISRMLGTNFPYELQTAQLRERLTKVFTDLYLGLREGDLKILPKLAIFYDYAEFTPVGKLGDQIIRYLAEQLFELNLLDQATTLLDYQVKNRLKGAARSEVAADVALMHLMNNKASDAIRILHETRQASIPTQVEVRRLLLEAQALLALSRPDSARALIHNIQGDQAERIRMDADMALQDWQSLGERSENFLGERWRDSEPLNQAERQHVLRAVVSYALAEDDLGIRRVQQKFAKAMSMSEDAAAFDVLTDVSSARGRDFADIAEQIASTSNFDNFVKENKAKGLSISQAGSDGES